MLIPYVALADGESTYSTRILTDHMESNLWLAEKILGVSFSVKKRDGLVVISKK